MTTSLPFATPDLPGVGGSLRVDPEDFRVDEIPLYEPSGEGEHLYVRIEKRGIATLPMIERLARAVGVRSDRIGFAGLKDAHAVTRQTLSLQGVSEAVVAEVDIPGVTVVSMARHGNKLRRGHLAGNRFDILLRDVDAGGAVAAQRVIDRLATHGVPNYFGSQRFGNDANSDRLGVAILKGDGDGFLSELLRSNPAAEEAARQGDYQRALDAVPRGKRFEERILATALRTGRSAAVFQAIPKPLRRLMLSAAQSELFNQLLAERIDRYGEVELGDLAWLHDRGAVFLVEDLDECRPRAARGEISPSGPLFGQKCSLPSGEPLAREEAVLARNGLDRPLFAACRELSGVRRPFRVPIGGAGVEEIARPGEGTDLRLTFELPRGSYATVVVREVSKNNAGSGGVLDRQE